MMNSLYRGALLGAMLAAAAANAGDVTVENPYVRAVPPGQKVSAAFMTLHNAGTEPRALVAAAGDASEVVELHTHIHEDGMMKMRQVAKIEIPGGGSTELKPGGYHVMLINLKRQLEPGDTVSLELRFDDGSTLAVQAPVKEIGAGMMMHKQHGGEMKTPMGGMGGMAQ